MAKSTINEVEVLRFFETESLDKASVFFNIVADKMRTRLDENSSESMPVEAAKRRARKTVEVELIESVPLD